MTISIAGPDGKPLAFESDAEPWNAYPPVEHARTQRALAGGIRGSARHRMLDMPDRSATEARQYARHPACSQGKGQSGPPQPPHPSKFFVAAR
jgi:hypothetical protein